MDFLIGKASVYEAYSYLLLGEAFCAVTIDGQLPPMTRAETWQVAVDKFDQAVTFAERVTSGSDLAEAQRVATLARVGRMRANLNLGDYPAVLADAPQVPIDFVYNATFDASPARRENSLVLRNVPGDILSVHGSFHNLEVGGVPDPRVQYVEDGLVFTGRFPVYRQLKYTSDASEIPIGTGREAQLMVAEASGGQTAVGIINQLRADPHNLPPFVSADENEIQAMVREERRRELWMQGHRIGDKLRYDEAWVTGVDPQGRPYGDLTCWPLHDSELEG
jgi:hypothetical protein